MGDMELAAVRDHVEAQCEFPIDHDDLVAAVGNDEVVAPTTESESIKSILERSTDRRYQSPDAVYTTIMGCVGEEFVGLKRYDDRAGARSIPEDRYPRTV